MCFPRSLLGPELRGTKDPNSVHRTASKVSLRLGARRRINSSTDSTGCWRSSRSQSRSSHLHWNSGLALPKEIGCICDHVIDFLSAFVRSHCANYIGFRGAQHTADQRAKQYSQRVSSRSFVAIALTSSDSGPNSIRSTNERRDIRKTYIRPLHVQSARKVVRQQCPNYGLRFHFYTDVQSSF
jgi:hypothetical protein